MRKRIGVGTVKINETVKALINEILESNRISQGRYVAEFEKAFARYHQIKHCVAVSSGTAAISLALACLYDLDAKRGDEVITTALSFVATTNAVVHAGFSPVFVDVDPKTFNIDPRLIEARITKRTRAILPVHLFGRPADMDEILRIAKRRNLTVVEDCAEAHGARYKAKKVGTMGAMGTFSFYVAHIITTGEGGAIITQDDRFSEILNSLRAHGRACTCKVCVLNTKSAYCPLRFRYGDDRDARFYFERIGFSEKMNELEAAIGVGQMQELEDILEARRKNLVFLNKNLSRYGEFLKPFEEGPLEKISPLAYPLVIAQDAPFNKRDIVSYLEKNGIDTRPMFGSIPTQQPAYQYLGHKLGDFPNAEEVGNRGFYIGCHQDLSKEDLGYIVETFGGFFKKGQGGEC